MSNASNYECIANKLQAAVLSNVSMTHNFKFQRILRQTVYSAVVTLSHVTVPGVTITAQSPSLRLRLAPSRAAALPAVARWQHCLCVAGGGGGLGGEGVEGEASEARQDEEHRLRLQQAEALGQHRGQADVTRLVVVPTTTETQSVQPHTLGEEGKADFPSLLVVPTTTGTVSTTPHTGRGREGRLP